MRKNRRRMAAAGLWVAIGWASLDAQAQAMMVHIDLPAQPLGDALRAVGSRTNVNILFDPPLVAGRSAPAVNAQLTPQEAISRLLNGTGIRFEFLNDTTVVLAPENKPGPESVVPAATPQQTTNRSEVLWEPIRLAQAEPAAAPDRSAAAPEKEPADEVAQIVVTGSRISRPDFVSQQPMVTTSAADLQASAKINLETALQQMPQFQNGQDENFNAGAVGGGGRATLNLRGLGQQRTLVLLDGRRLPPTDGTGVANINDVPMGIVDNVQVISGGASAAYGSDAMAGVVNIITKTVDGLEVNVSQGMAEGGFGRRQDFFVNAGSHFAEGKGRAMISFQYTQRDAIVGGEIPFFLFGGQSTNTPYGQYTPTTAITGRPVNAPSQAAVDAYFAGFGAAPGTVLNSTLLGFNDDGTLFSTRAPFTNYKGVIGPGTGFQNVGGSLIVDIGQYAFVTVPQSRYSAFTKETYSLTDNVDLYFQALGKREVISTQNTYFPVGASALTTVPVTNPFIPQDLAALLASRNSPNEAFTFSKRFVDIAPSRWNEHFDTAQFLIGAKGKLPGTSLNWDVYYMRDYSLVSEVQKGVISQVRYNGLLNAPAGGANICEGGFDPFQGFHSYISEQCYAYLTVDTHTTTVENQHTIEANLSGKLIDLPAGEARFALTADWRRWDSDFSPDNLLVLGNPASSAGGGFNPTSGEISVREIAGEVLVPLLKDVPFAQSLNLNLGFRHSDYDISGGANTYKIATDWRPVSSLLIRGGFEHAIRAPNINDLFQTPTQATVQIGNVPLAGDPCDWRSSVRNGPNGAQVAALCVAQGIPQSQIAGYTYAFTSSPIVTSGSLAVKPEEANTYSVGAVFTPGFSSPAFENLQLSLDYFHIRISDAIGASGYQSVLNECYNLNGANPGYSATNPACQLIDRNFGGTVGGSFRIGQPTMNLGGLINSGIDAEVDWQWRLADLGLGERAGQLRLNSTVSWTERFDIQQLPSSPWVSYAGSISLPLSPTPPVPTWRALTTLSYAISPVPVTVGLRWRYINAMKDQSVVLNPASRIPGVPTFNYLDFVASWKITDQIELSGTATNITEKDPPIVNATAGLTQLGFYDLGPRTYLLSLRAKF